MTVSVVDFVPPSKKARLEEGLRNLTDLDEPDIRSVSSMRGPSFQRDEWGSLSEQPPDGVDEIQIEVLRSGSLPGAHILRATAKIDDAVPDTFPNEGAEQDLNAVRDRFADYWEDIGQGLPGIVRESGTSVVVNPPITLSTALVEIGTIEAFLDIGEFQDATVGDLNAAVRESEVLRWLGLTGGGLVSVTEFAPNALTLIGQTKAIQTNYGFSHDGYLIVHAWEDTREPIGALPLMIALIANRLLLLIFLVIFPRQKLIELNDYRELPRSLATTTVGLDGDLSGIEEDLGSAYEDLEEFYRAHAQVMDVALFADDYLEGQERLNESPPKGETALPTDRLVSFETGEPVRRGVFETLIEDARNLLRRTRSRYEGVGEMCQLLSRERSNRLDLAVSLQNVRLQDRLNIYTIVLVGLTILVFLQGTGILGWMMENASAVLGL